DADAGRALVRVQDRVLGEGPACLLSGGLRAAACAMAGAEAVVRAEFIDPGSFRHELALEEATAVPDDTGGYVESWTEIAVVFARMEPLAATSRFGADQTLETVTHRVTMRHRK